MLSSGLSTLRVLAHLTLVAVCEIGTVIIPILQKRIKERLSNLPKVFIVVGIGANI